MATISRPCSARCRRSRVCAKACSRHRKLDALLPLALQPTAHQLAAHYEILSSGPLLTICLRLLRASPGSDYRYPTEDELSAIEAFLLSLGPPGEFDIERMTFTSLEVEQGRQLFLSERSGPCTDCHHNVGALDLAGVNGLFDIGIQHRIGSPGLLIDPAMPGDGGFGTETASVIAAGKVGFGDGRFNPPSLVQAADTVPLFHDHSALSLEAAIHFYVSPDFINSVEGRQKNPKGYGCRRDPQNCRFPSHHQRNGEY